ncbi:MAG: Jag N-terminal domain-containing protein [Acidimicrobiia bacterium]|nr:Jag N-terminal domain-containing protein [Acidimicrobiia bacterium]MDH4306797.1 Jag N-terminal domain-containing protein [Acidimicrobiia bacterium]MDH5292375.1 Jag N-terminal domain-containing protein [Acidimicrobiia bacterium]
MDFVEVRGKTIDVAVEAAMQELGVTDRERIDVEVIQQPEKAVLGLFGGRDAVVKVKLKPADGKKRRRRRRKKGPGGEESGSEANRHQESGRQDPSRSRQRNRDNGDRGGGQGNRQHRGDGSEQGGGRGQRPQQRSQQRRDPGERPRRRQEREENTVSIEEQVPVVDEFLTGLVGAFGLDGAVEVSIDGDVIIANVSGGQTEAMVGPRGSVIEAVHELTKTVLHRRTESSSRLRLDIAGYAERRRQALAIYAAQLIDQVTAEGGEVMLEPMSASDRKVIHDAVADRSGVKSYSEGESPQRYVVIAAEKSEDTSEEE